MVWLGVSLGQTVPVRNYSDAEKVRWINNPPNYFCVAEMHEGYGTNRICFVATKGWEGGDVGAG